jgi:hypothetical protein
LEARIWAKKLGRRTSVVLAIIVLLLVRARGALAEEQIQAPVFEEGNYWKFNVVTKVSPNFSPANELWNGIYVIRYVNGRIAVRKLIDEKASGSGNQSSHVSWFPPRRARAYIRLSSLYWETVAILIQIKINEYG